MRLTEEQEELRLAGLRILARLIVRAYLASQLDDIAEARRFVDCPGRKTDTLK